MSPFVPRLLGTLNPAHLGNESALGQETDRSAFRPGLRSLSQRLDSEQQGRDMFQLVNVRLTTLPQLVHAMGFAQNAAGGSCGWRSA